MKIVNHGEWKLYAPDTMPLGAPLNTAFTRRKDGRDWYEYNKNSFKEGSVIVACVFNRNGWVVSAANYDPTMIFPAGQMVLEVMNYDGDNPQKELENKSFNPESNSFDAAVE